MPFLKRSHGWRFHFQIVHRELLRPAGSLRAQRAGNAQRRRAVGWPARGFEINNHRRCPAGVGELEGNARLIERIRRRWRCHQIRALVIREGNQL